MRISSGWNGARAFMGRSHGIVHEAGALKSESNATGTRMMLGCKYDAHCGGGNLLSGDSVEYKTMSYEVDEPNTSGWENKSLVAFAWECDGIQLPSKDTGGTVFAISYQVGSETMEVEA